MRSSFFITGTLVQVLAIARSMADTAQLAGQTPGKFADPAAQASAVSPLLGMGQVTLALALIVGLLFGVAWLLRRFKLFNRSADGSLHVVQAISVGPKERAVVLQVQGRRLLLGVAPGCVQLLTELSPEVDSSHEATSTADSSTPNAEHAPSFKSLLKRSMGLSNGERS